MILQDYEGTILAVKLYDILLAGEGDANVDALLLPFDGLIARRAIVALQSQRRVRVGEDFDFRNC